MSVTAVEADEQLVEFVYAAALGEASWHEFLGRLSATLPDGRSTLFYHDVTLRRGAWELSHGLDQSALAQYSSHFCKINPWMPKASVRQIGLGVVAEQMLPVADLRKTEFYNDFLTKQNCHSAVGVTIMREGERSFLLSTLTSRADPDANMAAANRLTRLAPHLRRVFKYLRSGPFPSKVGEIGASLCNAIDIGLIIVGEDRAIRSISAEGQRIVETGSGVGITSTGRLRVSSPEGEDILKQMTDRAYCGEMTVAMTVNAVKLTFIRVVKDSISSFFEGPTVIVLLEPKGKTGAIDLDSFRRAYGLNRSEIRALSGFVEGKGVYEIADAAKRSPETIRSQIKSLYAKIGVHSKFELLKLVYSNRAGSV